MKFAFRFVLFMLLAATTLPAADVQDKASTRPTDAYSTRTLEGWTVHVSQRLLDDHKKQTDKAIELLTSHLDEIIKVVPASAVARLREVPLWISRNIPASRPAPNIIPTPTG